MLSVPCTLVHADGAVEHTAFRMTAPKLATLEAKGSDAVDAFLRSKVTHKGYHGSWRRYGSWTLQDEGGEETYLFAWAYGKGAAPHAKCYTLDSEAMQVYDDVLLLRFPALDAVTLAEAMALTEPQVSGWLGCIAVAAAAAAAPKATPAAKAKAKKKKPKPKAKPAATAPVQLPVKDETAVFEVEEEGLLKDGSAATATFTLADPANDDASGSDDDELPVVAPTAATAAQSDDEDNDEDNDDEDDVADGPIDTALFDLEEGDAEEGVDDEDDDDAEPAVDVLEAHMLQYEDYEYHDKTIPCQLPSLYSLWTSVG